jgi:hypothetical protein
VCQDIIESPPKSNVFVIFGSTFKVKENAFVRPYLSSDYNTFIVSKLDGLFGEWNLKNLLCKMYTPSRTRYLLDILKTKSYLLETYLIDNYLVTYCHLLKISFLNI